jgi:crotonobetainyl-CoA:carnitine CoA-transferase CaiB-like acyl-CoA transferase
MIEARMREKTLDEWMAIFSASDIGADPFLAPGEFLDHVHHSRRQNIGAVSEDVGERMA